MVASQRQEQLPLLNATYCDEGSQALRILPDAGAFVVFFNHDPMLRMLKPYALHGSCPVLEGRKRIAQRFYQWFPLHTQNSFGQLVRQVGLGKDWKWKPEYSR